jgi:outer membrane lipoprotein
MRRKHACLLAALAMLVVAGCNRYEVVPKQYQEQVNRSLSFVEARSNPDAYKGDTVVWGGEVLNATRLPDRTKLEVLQLPLTDDLVPAAERAESNGRFLAFDTQGEILDPAVVKEGTRVTIVGEIEGAVSSSSDLGPQDYPALRIKDMTIWDKSMSRSVPSPTYGPYYGHYYYGYRPYVFWNATRVSGS